MTNQSIVDASPRRILIVDDDDVVGDLLAALFADAGYDPHVVASPADAEGTYDLVIADYLAPSFLADAPWPHLESLRRLSAGAPIVGCTAHQDAASGDLPALGVSAVVVKPFDLEQILATVEQLLGPCANSALAN